MATVVPFSNRLSFLPSLYGRVLIGHKVGYPYLNALGGEIFGRYLPQQMPFAGISHLEILNNALAVLRFQFRERIADNNYISLIGNYAIHQNNFFKLIDGQSIWGGSIGYAYNSIAGPLSANIGMSSRNKKVQFYLNLGFYF
jgi:NTE family protein